MPTNGPNGARRARGRNDPARRERIANAALAVVAERGVEGLTHRAVAAVAGVPLGSTTYHFATLDDLLAVALQDAADTDAEEVRQWEACLPDDADFASALADLVMRSLGPNRHRTLVAYELYVAALHRPRLRAISIAWDAELLKLFIARTDPVTGQLLAVAYCGLLMQAVLSDPPPERQQVAEVFRRALRSA